MQISWVCNHFYSRFGSIYPRIDLDSYTVPTRNLPCGCSVLVCPVPYITSFQSLLSTNPHRKITTIQSQNLFTCKESENITLNFIVIEYRNSSVIRHSALTYLLMFRFFIGIFLTKVRVRSCVGQIYIMCSCYLIHH